MNAPIPINNFDRGKPFYPLVMNYVVQLIGFKEIAIRGAIGAQYLITEDIVRKVAGGDGIANVEQEASKIEEVTKNLKKLLGPLELRSEFQENHIMVEIDPIAKELAGNILYLAPYFLRAASNLLILAHEICKDEPYHDQSPLWEFLRHCRNAAAHGGKFTFLNNEPRRLAQWGKFNIIAELENTPLFKGEDGVGLLFPGDPIRLLWDIEQAFPNMKA